MTIADDLRAAADAEDEARIRRLLRGLPEADRSGLAAIAREVVATQTKRGLGAADHLGPMSLLAYGILPVSDIRRLGWRSNHLPSGLDEVLRGRSPERLGPIVDFLLDEVTDWSWPIVRPLVRDGVVPRPDRPSYTIAMLAATRRRSVAELVRADPGLLDVEVWRLFEVEGGGEDSLANHEKFFGDQWGEQFRALAATDPALRARVLDASLDALGRDFTQYRAGWFSRFHESLQPTDEERTQRAEAYLRLLRARVGPTVSFAIAALDRIERSGGLPADAFLDAVGPVLTDAAAGTARQAIGLIGRAGRASADRARRAAVVAADALAHPSPDVQRTSIDLIGRLAATPVATAAAPLDPALPAAVAARIPHVSASQRVAAQVLLARLGGARGGEEPAAPAHHSAIATRPTADPASSPGRQSPIDPDRAIEPLASPDALVDVAVSVLETGEPTDDIERILDAVGRLGGDRDARFTRLTSAIARRARTILARPESRPFTGFDARADVAAVLVAWTTGELVGPGPVPTRTDPGAGAFLSARAHEAAVAAAAVGRHVTIAAPTHRGGWIDPAALVGRLETLPAPSHRELVAALLRLAPDGRPAALRSAAGLAGEVGSVTRYALGGDEAIGPTAAWWVAAARVRAPGRDDPAVERRHPGLGPGAGRAARARLRSKDPRPTWGGLWLEIEPPLVDVVPRPAGGVNVDLPSVLLLREPPSLFAWSGRSDATMLRWMATIQPGDRTAWAAVGSLVLARNIDWWSAEWANRAFLEPFVDPTTTIGPHARLLLAIALGAKEAGERGLAADVVGLGLADGRLTAPELGEGLTASAEIGCDRPIRWATSLADVAGGSDRHRAGVAEAVGRALPALADRPPAKLVPLLRLLDELLAATGGSVVAEARPVLERLAGSSGRAGRLARVIVARA